MKSIEQLADISQTARCVALAAIYNAESGHPGGAMSCMDVLVFCLYNYLNINKDNYQEHNRDRFVLSKGHAAPALYAVAASQNLMTEHEALQLRKLNAPAQGHPDKQSLPWLDASTGSLGQGFSNAVGMALANQYRGYNAKVVALLGDGELQEGQVWEAAMSAAHHKLGKLTAVIDYNKLQSDDSNDNIMQLAPLAEKFATFGWQVIEIDGHNLTEIAQAFEQCQQTDEQPTVIIAHTIKGKGVDYMEGVATWHGSVRMTRENIVNSLTQLGMSLDNAETWLTKAVQRVD